MNSVVISNACGRMSGVFFGRPLHPQYLQLSFEFFIFSSISCKQLIYNIHRFTPYQSDAPESQLCEGRGRTRTSEMVLLRPWPHLVTSQYREMNTKYESRIDEHFVTSVATIVCKKCFMPLL